MNSDPDHAGERGTREHAGIRRLRLSGTLATGVLAFIFAINASLDGEWIGAGVLLIAAALAFGQRGGLPGPRFRG
ncbi:MAG: hypothetical protein QF554_11130 [Dehalococcoidia bacterium]|jgi:hypothetical protein|nr:hypothetical protein [Dehalococcoidia bacterium]